MPLEPKLADFPRIRGALRFYRVCAIITGVLLLLLCLEMVVKYGFGHELFLGGSGGFLALTPSSAGATGLNLSTGILIVHGWFYVVYLLSDFTLWSRMRWTLPRFIVIALGGVVPFLSFIVEVRMSREIEAYLTAREAAEVTAQPALAAQVPVGSEP